MKPKEYNPEQEVLFAGGASPALAAERYPRRAGLPAPVTAPLAPTSAPGAAGEPSVTPSTFAVVVLTDGKTRGFQKPKGR